MPLIHRILTADICLMLMLFHTLAQAQSAKANAHVSPQTEYTEADSALVVHLLSQAKSQRGSEHPMLWFGRQFIGVPYVAHTLEGGSTEHLIVNLHELDCTTFVETVLALTLCDANGKETFADFCNQLKQIRYRDGEIRDYTSRLHYFTWWAEDNERKGLVTARKPNAATTQTQSVNINYMSTHPTLYRQLKQHPNFTPIIKRMEDSTRGTRIPYVPKQGMNDSQSSALGTYIQTGDIVAMLTRKPGLDTSHIGIAVWQGGKLHLLNASSVYKKVVLDTKTFYDYMQVQTSQTGVRSLKVNLPQKK